MNENIRLAEIMRKLTIALCVLSYGIIGTFYAWWAYKAFVEGVKS